MPSLHRPQATRKNQHTFGIEGIGDPYQPHIRPTIATRSPQCSVRLPQHSPHGITASLPHPSATCNPPRHLVSCPECLAFWLCPSAAPGHGAADTCAVRGDTSVTQYTRICYMEAALLRNIRRRRGRACCNTCGSANRDALA